MNAPVHPEKLKEFKTENSERFAKCIEISKRVTWEIERDIIRGRKFDLDKPFLPNGLSQVDKLEFLTADEKRLLSQIQGRTYCNIFGLVERFICAKVIEISGDYSLGDQIALEALVRFSEEEIKHQELFRQLDRMAEQQMPKGYNFLPDPDDVARAVLGKSTWSVLGLTLHIELFTQLHYRESINPRNEICPLWKDVFKFHWKEESQHAIMDEIEWKNEDQKLTDAERNAAVDDLIALVAAVDGILQLQAEADVNYFVRLCNSRFDENQVEEIQRSVLAAYRWQYIYSGLEVPRFIEVLSDLITNEQSNRIGEALGNIQ